MPKVCNKCFKTLPADAHYCPWCGVPLELKNNKPVEYQVVASDFLSQKEGDNAATIRTQTRTILDLRQRLTHEQLENTRLRAQLKSASGSWLTKIPNWLWVGIAVVVLAVAGYFYYDAHRTPDVISVNGKYGIGRHADRLLVPARYDSISGPWNNMWVLFDNETQRRGLAYIDGDVCNVIEPTYTEWNNYDTGTSLLTYPDGTVDIAYQGIVTNAAPYKSVYKDLFLKGIHNALVVQFADGRYGFVTPQGVLVDGKKYADMRPNTSNRVLVTDVDTDGKQKVFLHDYQGQRVSDRGMYRVLDFADDVAWAVINQGDSGYSLIDVDGNLLFNLPRMHSGLGFRDGMALYSESPADANGMYQWQAIDKQGNTLFTVTANDAGHFTMGLAPLIHGNGANAKMGFVDTQGQIVIPFVYQPLTNDWSFSPDSLMAVSLNGVAGTLHRNGTFRPSAPTPAAE